MIILNKELKNISFPLKMCDKICEKKTAKGQFIYYPTSVKE